VLGSFCNHWTTRTSHECCNLGHPRGCSLRESIESSNISLFACSVHIMNTDSFVSVVILLSSFVYLRIYEISETVCLILSVPKILY
jgi:hypothetical protein